MLSVSGFALRVSKGFEVFDGFCVWVCGFLGVGMGTTGNSKF